MCSGGCLVLREPKPDPTRNGTTAIIPKKHRKKTTTIGSRSPPRCRIIPLIREKQRHATSMQHATLSMVDSGIQLGCNKALLANYILIQPSEHKTTGSSDKQRSVKGSNPKLQAGIIGRKVPTG